VETFRQTRQDKLTTKAWQPHSARCGLRTKRAGREKGGTENMKYNLKNRPENKSDYVDITEMFQKLDEYTAWFEGFEKRQRLIHSEPQNWLALYKTRIMERFKHHSVSELTPEELLTYFIEEEVLGVEQKIKEEMKR
jgi:hypothetical protein